MFQCNYSYIEMAKRPKIGLEGLEFADVMLWRRPNSISMQKPLGASELMPKGLFCTLTGLGSAIKAAVYRFVPQVGIGLLITLMLSLMLLAQLLGDFAPVCHGLNPCSSLQIKRQCFGSNFCIDQESVPRLNDKDKHLSH